MHGPSLAQCHPDRDILVNIGNSNRNGQYSRDLISTYRWNYQREREEQPIPKWIGSEKADEKAIYCKNESCPTGAEKESLVLSLGFDEKQMFTFGSIARNEECQSAAKGSCETASIWRPTQRYYEYIRFRHRVTVRVAMGRATWRRLSKLEARPVPVHVRRQISYEYNMN